MLVGKIGLLWAKPLIWLATGPTTINWAWPQPPTVPIRPLYIKILPSKKCILLCFFFPLYTKCFVAQRIFQILLRKSTKSLLFTATKVILSTLKRKDAKRHKEKYTRNQSTWFVFRKLKQLQHMPIIVSWTSLPSWFPPSNHVQHPPSESS